MYEAQREALGVPEHDRHSAASSARRGHFSLPEGAGAAVLVEITVVPRRSACAERTRFASSRVRFAALRCPAADVLVVLPEPLLEIRGRLGSSVADRRHLAFRLDV